MLQPRSLTAADPVRPGQTRSEIGTCKLHFELANRSNRHTKEVLKSCINVACIVSNGTAEGRGPLFHPYRLAMGWRCL